MSKSISEIMMGIFLIIVLLGFASYILFSIYNVSTKTPMTCDEHGEVKFVWIGSLFGGQKQITEGEHYDGYMEVCIKGKTLWGKEWKRSNYDALVSGEEQ